MKTRIRMLVSVLPVLPVLVAAFAASAVPCGAQMSRSFPSHHTWRVHGGDGVARIDTVVSFAADGTVDLSLISGQMKVTTWNRNEVRIVASTSGPRSLQLDASNSHITLEQRMDNRRGNGDDVGSATYQVIVPAGVHASLTAISGQVEASGIQGSVSISTVSGGVDVRDIGSSLRVEGVSGAITATNVRNDVHMQNVSGRITVTGAAGVVDVETVSGDVAIGDVSGDRVHATTVTGDIDFTGSVSPSGRYDLETHSGRARLALPDNANAVIRVGTFSGSVSNRYPGAVRRSNDNSGDGDISFEYVINRGGGRIRIDTFSGSVYISQENR